MNVVWVLGRRKDEYKLPNNLWEDFLEDLEAMGSENSKRSIEKVRNSPLVSMEEVVQELDL